MKLDRTQATYAIVVNIVLFGLVVICLSNYFNVARQEVVPETEQSEIVHEDALGSIHSDDLRKTVSWLADDVREGRMSGKKGNIDSAEFIESALKSYGMQVRRQKFSIKRVNPGPKNEIGNDYTENVVGIFRGKSPRQIVIGAHFDHIGYGPEMSRSRERQIHNGADDNASGVAAVLEIAEACSKLEKPLNHTIVFTFFSAEEMGLIGSRHYVSSLSASEKSEIDLMMNFDMVGWLKGQSSLTLSGIRELPSLVKITESLDDNYSFKVKIGSSSSGGSDHASFGNVGIGYVFFHTGLHDHYHTPTDDTDLVDFSGMEEITKFGFETLVKFDELELVRTKKVGYPVVDDMTHDHGQIPFPIERHIND